MMTLTALQMQMLEGGRSQQGCSDGIKGQEKILWYLSVHSLSISPTTPSVKKFSLSVIFYYKSDIVKLTIPGEISLNWMHFR